MAGVMQDRIAPAIRTLRCGAGVGGATTASALYIRDRFVGAGDLGVSADAAATRHLRRLGPQADPGG
jgi:hypothetical protein